MRALKPFAMRNLLFCLLHFPLLVLAQKREIFRIDSLPKEGVLLNQGWKWQVGDNPEWAKPEYDDSGWEPIDPTKDIHALPQVFNARVKWLRLTFEVTNRLPLPLGLSINQAGASEIYLNGQLLQRIGHIDKDSTKVKAVDPLEFPINFPLDTIGKYHLAIRYSLQPNINYTRIYGWTQNCLFRASIVDLMAAQQGHREYRVYYTGLEIFRIGLLFMLFVLHFSFYFYQKQNKTHLLLAFYFLGSLLQYVLKIVGQNQFSVEARFITLNTSAWCSAIGNLFGLTAFYKLSKVPRNIHYKIMVAIVIVSLVVSNMTYGLLWFTLLLITAFLNFLIMLRLTSIGIKNKIKGFAILGIGVMISSLGFFIIGLRYLNFPISPYLADVIFNLSAISVPIGLSLFMGIEAAEITKALRIKLTENEELKDQTLAQEKEKQELLAAQNETLERQVNERTAALNQSLETLQSAQAQLIQSEKLASLGELTAGIAHEIQNPLNFVNNFAELSVELADELKEEINKPELDKGLIEELAADLATNQEKINHHGKRASAIVKGMLEHSRTSTGVKEPTDINGLADEYLRLAYHGLRAKDSTFNATMETHFDPDLPNVKVIPQDIGRVILNLINNAFYAVAERSRSTVQQRTVETLHATSLPYQPTVIISTKRLDNAIEISVKDNGTGIPDAIKDKIFQPFFTTKPTGQGTGLGLSLAYDIVTKGHGGTLEVESKDGIGSTFIIALPMGTF
jgi:two-component system, NtrC family, sensor kinase